MKNKRPEIKEDHSLRNSLKLNKCLNDSIIVSILLLFQ
jgi:hypothetical protein